ncbi:nuclease-like protein [Comamonas thiooxydans]|nr:nuclease-like protein [Comamonas thiooxydans]
MLASALIRLVVGVSDDDALTARCGKPGQDEQVKVRLQGIDALERKQPFGGRPASTGRADISEKG